MTPQQQTRLSEQAKAYIDKIASINKKHGMGVVKDAYDNAVKDAATTATTVASRA